MALRDILTGEMIELTRAWEDKQDVLTRYPLTAPFVGVLAEARASLVASTQRRPPDLSAEERKQISTALAELDGEFDHCARVLSSALDMFALAFPEQGAQLGELKQTLFPEGLRLITSSYRNEAGEAARIAARIEGSPAMLDLLKKTKLDGKRLKGWYDRLVDVGARMGPLAERLDLTEVRTDEVVMEFKARQSWISVVGTLRRTAELAGWSEADSEAIFGPADRISAQRATPRRPSETGPAEA